MKSEKKRFIVIIIVLIVAAALVFIGNIKEQRNIKPKEASDITVEQDVKNIYETEMTEEQLQSTDDSTKESESNNYVMQCMEEYLTDVPEINSYFALKDINSDGVEELLYRRDEDYVSYLTVLGYMQGQLYVILDLEYQQYSSDIALCNGNELALVEALSDGQMISYYHMNGTGYEMKTINKEIDYEEDEIYRYFIDGEECSEDDFSYYDVSTSDWMDFNGQYPENRYVKSVEKFIFHENTEEGRKSAFEDQFCFAEYDKAVLKNLIGIIGYMENEGQYTTGTEMSPQEWSDEAKLEFMDCLIASGLVNDYISTSFVSTERLNEPELNVLLQDNENSYMVDFSYYAMGVDDMNCILENVLGVRVDGQLSTELAKYYNDYYIFRVGQFIDWIPYSEITDEPVTSENGQNYIVHAETGIGLFDYDENAEIPFGLEGNDIRHFRDVYMKKNKESICATVRIMGWSADDPFELQYSE